LRSGATRAPVPVRARDAPMRAAHVRSRRSAKRSAAASLGGAHRGRRGSAGRPCAPRRRAAPAAGAAGPGGRPYGPRHPARL